MPEPEVEDGAEDLAEIAGPVAPSLADALALELAQAPRRGRRRRPGEPAAPAQTAAQATAQASARAFLDKQSRMLDIQMEHLHEQRGLSLSHLRLRRLNEGFKVALQVLACTVGFAVVLFVGTLAWQAWRSRALVIEPIRTPPDLAQRGLDGTALSARLLDKLRVLQDATDSARAPNTYTHAWGDDIKLQIPETGVSVSELQSYLRRWLGHDIHISGEVFRGWSAGRTAADGPPDAIFLTVRAGDSPGATLTGREDQADELVEQAAERLYASTQPYRWSVYLARHGRLREAAEGLARLASSASLEERAWANAYLGGVTVLLNGDFAAGAAHERAALKLDPALVIARDNLAGQEVALGQDGAAVSNLSREYELLSGGRAHDVAPEVAPVMRAWAQARVRAAEGDYAGAADAADTVRQLPDYEGSAEAALLGQAAMLALGHDVAAARAALAGAGGANPSASFNRSIGWGSNQSPEVAIDRALDDWPAARRDLMAIAQDRAPRDFIAAAAVRTTVWPWLAYAEARTGDLAAARARIGATPLDCGLCLVMRGRIAAQAGDIPAARGWFARARREAPGLPRADFAWAEMLLARGDADGAIDRFRAAAELAPRFADPLEGWGEGLLKRGEPRRAADRFAAAARLAPRWGRNRLRWGEALLRTGHRAEARAQLEAADALVLSAPDRAALTALLARTPAA